MSFDRERLVSLLPTVLRIRDAQNGMPLAGLMSVLASQIAVLEEDLEQLYDDQFIETCAPWAVPYLGELVGNRSVMGTTGHSTARADVARTIAYRRRKGTAAILEQIARDITGWPARAIEFFELTCRSAHMNHLRSSSHYSLDVRDRQHLSMVNGPFETAKHVVDVRSIGSGAGKYKPSNVGIYLWRLIALAHMTTPSKLNSVSDDGRFLFSPLRTDLQLFVRPEREASLSTFAQQHQVPQPLTRLEATRNLALYYGADKSIHISIDGADLPIEQVCICNLADAEDGGWYHSPPADKVAIDPELGRLFVGSDMVQSSIRVLYHYGQAGAMGGGVYERRSSFDQEPLASSADYVFIKVPDDRANLSQAFTKLGSRSGVIEITDSERYQLDSIEAFADNQRVQLRAANGCRPTLELTSDLEVSGAAGSALMLNGLLITGANLTVPRLIPGRPAENLLDQLAISHCTLVPGLTLTRQGLPENPNRPSVVVQASQLRVQLIHSICGPVRMSDLSSLAVSDSIIDAMQSEGVAVANLDGTTRGGLVSFARSTVLGSVHAARADLILNSIFLQPVRIVRKQSGCCAFSYLPPGSQTPRRFRCQPEAAVTLELDKRKNAAGTLSSQQQTHIIAEVRSRVRPSWSSSRYGEAAYAQLAAITPMEIYSGADDESEMGVFHSQYQALRIAQLHTRLTEYLKLGLEVGVFLEN